MNGTSTHGSDTPVDPTPCTQAYPVSGTITSVGFHQGYLGNMTTVGSALVKVPQEQHRGLLGEEFILHFSKETRVFEQQESGCQSVSLTSLQVGQLIQIEHARDIMQSYPPQVVALQLLIVADGGGGS